MQIVFALLKLATLLASMTSLLKGLMDGNKLQPVKEDTMKFNKDLSQPVKYQAPQMKNKGKSKNSPFFKGIIYGFSFFTFAYFITAIINKILVPVYSHAIKVLPGKVSEFVVDEGILRYYHLGDGPPLLLLHSINAGASSHEVERIYNYYKQTREVFALDLLGFGLSDRPEIKYTPELYTQHIKEFLTFLNAKFNMKIDVIAISLTSEYLANIAVENNDLINRMVLISPTGLNCTPKSSNKMLGKFIYCLIKYPVFGQAMFNWFSSKTYIRNYLTNYVFMDPRKVSYLMMDNYYHTSHVEGAKNAPAFFISGKLFIKDIFKKYLSLQIPTLIIRGTGSERIVDFDCIAALLKQNEFVSERFIDGGGSLPHFEKPDEFFDISDKFLEAE